MGGKTGLETGLALLLAAGMAWAGGAPGGEGNRGLSPIIRNGEELMFTMDAPYTPPQEPSVVVAQAANAGAAVTPDFIFKACKETEHTPNNPRSALRGVDPAGMLEVYYLRLGKTIDIAGIKTIVLESTTHGKLTAEVDNTGLADYRYDPTPGYLGDDRATFMAEYGGKRYKIIVTIKVLEIVDESGSACPDATLIKVKKPRSDLPLDGVSVAFADLPNSSLGQTTGTTITLDTNAAGHGWYIDYTPYLNEEYLPTSNPNEWIAKEDSAASGKMDLLSVLLHEYGHALGIDHSADAHDLMATTLAPGVRRMPSSDELSLMARLAGEIKAGMGTPATPGTPSDPIDRNPDGPLPPNNGSVRVTRARITRNGTFVTGEDGIEREQPPQYEIAANPTLTDPHLESGAGWETAGNVAIGDGAAILSEAADRQTRLNQVFIIGEHDRYLTFTLAGINLDDQTSAPDDAFEAALLDANSGASLLAGTGLTHNDAFLNLQADGLERAGQNVTSTRNPDGSRTYRVDLVGIPAGTAVNLSFDLIGFGSATSQITVRDIRLGVPETHDDTAVTLEDTPIDIAVTANDLDADQPGFAPVVVAGPEHGTVTLNTAGGFTYTPDADWHGEDGFTYKLSDGAVDSNIAKVSLGVTAVNDAPTIEARILSLDEDAPLTFDPLAGAHDVDGDALSADVSNGPQHGTLTQNTDGTWIYTPDANFNGTDRIDYKVGDGETAVDTSITFIVRPINDAPVAGDLATALLEDGSLTLDLLANAYDIDGDVLAVAATDPQYGTLTRNDNGSFTYRPVADWNGEDGFAYTVSDGELTATAYVRLTVDAVADTPALVLTDSPGASREVFRTGWETVRNRNSTSTLVVQKTLGIERSMNTVAGADYAPRFPAPTPQ